MSVQLSIESIHWLQAAEDEDPSDQCAHGRVNLKVNGRVFVAADTGPWDLTMAGLYLLRTLTENNCPDDTVCEGNYLFPCCGHSPWLIGEGKYKLVCQGCNDGVTFELLHSSNQVQLSQSTDQQERVSPRTWRSAVLCYVTDVESFYRRSMSRTEPGDEALDRPGWEAFWKEWHERRAAAEHAA